MTDPRPAPSGHDWRPKRFMVIVAHPDDADFGPAGTAARWIDAGSVGWLVCCTSGDQGGEDPDLDPMQLALTREEEQRRAAAVVGYQGVTFLHQPDGALANDLPLRELLVREIRTFRPDAVFTHDPDVVAYARGGINHTDHRAAGIAAIDAVYPAARNPMAFPHLARNGLALHRVRRLYLFWPNTPDTWIETSETVVRKIGALREHVSQIKHPAELEERILRSAADTGEAIGAPAAEAFRIVVIDEDEEEGPSDEPLETASSEPA
jgi:LmbE family N-acetylglucosaminyl deacetylase